MRCIFFGHSWYTNLNMIFLQMLIFFPEVKLEAISLGTQKEKIESALSLQSLRLQGTEVIQDSSRNNASYKFLLGFSSFKVGSVFWLSFNWEKNLILLISKTSSKIPTRQFWKIHYINLVHINKSQSSTNLIRHFWLILLNHACKKMIFSSTQDHSCMFYWCSSRMCCISTRQFAFLMLFKYSLSNSNTTKFPISCSYSCQTV